MKYQRRYLRAPVVDQALLTLGEEVFAVNVQDISEGGVSVLSPKLITSGECSLMIALKNFKSFSHGEIEVDKVDIIRVSGRILPQIRDALVDGYKLAIEFNEMSLVNAKTIQEYVRKASMNLNFLVSLESSKNSEMQTVKERALDELGWFPHRNNFSADLNQFYKNTQWV